MNVITRLFILALLLLSSFYVRGDNMNEIYEFTKIHHLIEDPIKHLVSFTTDTGMKIWIEDKDEFEIDIKRVHRVILEDERIFIAYNPNTKLLSYSSSIQEYPVLRIMRFDKREYPTDPKKPPFWEIQLGLIPTPLYLFPTNPRFKEILQLLEYSKEKKQIIWVGTFPGDSEILDARLPIKH